MLYVELIAQSTRAVHSCYAPIVKNPASRIIRAVTSITQDSKVLFPEYYDSIIYPSSEDLRLISQINLNPSELAAQLGVREFSQSIPKKQLISKLFTEPSCNISGIFSGHSQEDLECVIPSKAIAKIEFKLLPNQTSGDIFRKLKAHLNSRGFADIEVLKKAAVEPSKTSIRERIAEVAIQAAKQAFGVNPVVYPLLYGFGPDYIFTNLLKVPSIGCGCGYIALAHQPNEYLTVDQFNKGIKLASAIMYNF